MTHQAQTPKPSVLVLTVDAFGEQVAERLRDCGRLVVHDIARGTHQSLWPAADLIVLSGGREQPRTADAVDATSFTRHCPWFAISVRGNEIQVGPVVRPDSTACYRCFIRRRDQHSRPDAVVHAADGPPVAPSGHARHHVAIAAGLARQAAREALGERPVEGLGGTVRVFNQVTGATTRVPVVAVDGCSRCGGRFEPPAGRRAALWRRLEQAAERTASTATSASRTPSVSVTPIVATVSGVAG